MDILLLVLFAYLSYIGASGIYELLQRGGIFGDCYQDVFLPYLSQKSEILYNAFGGCKKCFCMWFGLLIAYPLYLLYLWYNRYIFFDNVEIILTFAKWILFPFIINYIKSKNE